MIGKTLGTFECTALLGKGGMGEVYKAKDQKLGRDVAIKVLPEEFAKDADRVARFQREAKLLASLNHPNIAAIHGLEESDGTHFLVLELIEGDTLADRIKGRPIPVEEALKLALQISEALEAAHEKGVIHRDLKPANIKVTPDGKVKVLDFGLAKAFAGEQGEMNLSNSPTLSVAATQQGIILGTAAYMSPEQASGEITDKRTDIWAFGVVLFEMLAGRSLFEGNNVSQTLASVIKSEPEWQTLPPNLHPRIRLLLERCLEKESKNRYHDIADARVDVQKVLSDPSGVFAQTITTVKPRKKLRLGIPWVASAALLCLIIGGLAVWMLKPAPPPEPKQVMRLEYQIPEGQLFDGGLAIAPDGSKFVYRTNEGLYLRSMDELDARLISGTDKDLAQPFFSPDVQWIGYWSQSEQKLRKVAISGGAPVVLCDVGVQVYGASWYPEDTIVYSEVPNGIMRVSSNGGTPEALIKANLANSAEEGFPVAPQMLPDGKTLLFTSAFDVLDTAKMQIEIQSLESGDRKVLVRGGAGGTYLPSGHIVYALANINFFSLFAVPFDLDKLEVTGGRVSILENIGDFALSDSGTMVYGPLTAAAAGAANTASSADTLVWVDRQGKEESLATEPGRYSWLRISPDGTRVALAVSSVSDRDIWILYLDRENITRLTFADGNDAVPIWTPDSQRIIFASERESTLANGIWWKKADGTGEVEKLYSGTATEIVSPFSSSRDGKTLVLWTLTLTPVNANIETLSMDGDPIRSPLLQKNYNELYPQVSPDGRWIAYQSNESGRYEVFLRSFPDVNQGMWQVSKNGGDSPLWSPDGKELFYRSDDSFIAVEVETEPAFKIGSSAVLFKGRYARNPDVNECVLWDIHPDGKRFLMVKPPATAAAKPSDGESAAPAPQPKIIVVLNWFEELKERVPVE